MGKLAAVLSVSFVALMGIFILTILSTFLGGVSFWIIGGIFEYIPEVIQRVIPHTYTNFEVGSMIGFFSGVTRSTFSSPKLD